VWILIHTHLFVWIEIHITRLKHTHPASKSKPGTVRVVPVDLSSPLETDRTSRQGRPKPCRVPPCGIFAMYLLTY